MLYKDQIGNNQPKSYDQSSKPDSKHNVDGTQLTPFSESSKTELPCLVKAAGSFFGCLFGLIIGLILSLVCLIPVIAAFAYVIGGTSDYLNVIVVLSIIIAIITTILGIITGPAIIGKLLTSIVNVFRWMAGSR